MRSGSAKSGAAQCAAGAGWPGAARVGLALLGALLLGQAGWADEELPQPRWIPGLDLGFTTFDYSADATVENLINPPRYEGTQNDPLREFQFQIGGDLMGPMFEGLPGRPRPFIQGRIDLRPFSADKIYKIGEIRGRTETEVDAFAASRNFNIDRGCATNPAFECPTTDANSFTGQGAEIEAQFQNPSWYAALGVAFEFPVTETWLMQVRPSLAYFYDDIDFTARLRTVDEVDPVNEVFEIYYSLGKASTQDHNLGFGLEVALSMFRQDLPIRTWVYASAQFMYLISDPTTDFADPNGVAVYSVEQDRFGIRGGAGLRFSWMGFAGR